jgi:CO/xanthine dehydrogenase FAD-binding subunit
MRPEMVQPTTLEEAIAALSKRGAVPLAGATDLIPAMRKGEISPRTLVNLKGIRALAGVKLSGRRLRIGAATRVGDILTDDLLAQHAPILTEIARDFASVQIRNLATIGGNLCHAAPSADFALPLLVLDARFHIAGPEGRRHVPADAFFLHVNKTALTRGEVLTGVSFPAPADRTGLAQAKLTIRRAMDLAFVGIAAALTLGPDGKACRRARIALGSVAPMPMRARRAEAVLEGSPITETAIREAAAAAAAESRPITDLRASKEYRREMTEVLTRRVLQQAFDRARKEHAR